MEELRTACCKPGGMTDAPDTTRPRGGAVAVEAGAADAPAQGSAPDGGPVPDADELALLCKALAHPARVRIVEHLARVDRCVCGRIVEVLPLAQSTVSQHLKILKQCGLVRGEVDGPRTCYCIDKDKLDRFRSLASRAFGTCSEEG